MDIPYVSPTRRDINSAENGLLPMLTELQVGAGIKSFKSDRSGIWLGAQKFANAPFGVDIQGNAKMKSATFKDENDITIIDAKGLVSTATFPFGSVQDINNGRSTASTSFVDIPNTSITFSLSRSAHVLFLLYGDPGPVSIVNFDILRIQMALNIDGALYPHSVNGWGIVYKINDTSDAGYTESYGGWHGHLVVQLGTGSHTAKLQWKRGLSDTDDAGINNTVVSYLVLGK